MGIDGSISPIDRAISAIQPIDPKASQAQPAKEVEGGFVDMLKESMNEMIDLQNKAELMQQELAAGRVEDINEVIIAVQKADLALNLALELRNKVIEAYQEVSRMQL